MASLETFFFAMAALFGFTLVPLSLKLDFDQYELERALWRINGYRGKAPKTGKLFYVSLVLTVLMLAAGLAIRYGLFGG